MHHLRAPALACFPSMHSCTKGSTPAIYTRALPKYRTRIRALTAALNTSFSPHARRLQANHSREDLGKFAGAGGAAFGWPATMESQFTLLKDKLVMVRRPAVAVLEALRKNQESAGKRIPMYVQSPLVLAFCPELYLRGA